jgi:hypothetical protein
VVRELDSGPARRYQRRVAFDGLGEPAVQPAALARQQLLVHRLADQAVPERVAVGVGPQDVGSHRRPQRVGERGVQRGQRAVAANQA